VGSKASVYFSFTVIKNAAQAKQLAIYCELCPSQKQGVGKCYVELMGEQKMELNSKMTDREECARTCAWQEESGRCKPNT
jgi:hypothetical protein